MDNSYNNKLQNQQIRAAIYVRVSTREQAEHGYSLQEQIRSCREHCEKNNWKVTRIYKEEGVSGKNLDRPKLLLLFDHCEQYQFDVIVFWKLDRLTRNLKDFHNIPNLKVINPFK